MLRVKDFLTALPAQPNPLDGSLMPGQVGVVLGRNGAGKSWLMKSLAGLNPFSGNAHWDRQVLNLSRPAAQTRGYLAQEEPRVYPMSVRQHLMSGRAPWIDWHAQPSKNDDAIVQGALERLDVVHLADSSVQQLSGGEWQRVRLATLVAQQSKLWLLDEPAEHLDPGHIWSTLPGLIREQCASGGAVLLVAHDPDWAAQLADQVLLLGESQWSWGAAGEQLTEPKLDQLYGHPFVERDGRWLAG